MKENSSFKRIMIKIYAILLILIFLLSLAILLSVDDKKERIEATKQKIKEDCYNSEYILNQVKDYEGKFSYIKIQNKTGNKYRCLITSKLKNDD